MDDEIAKKLIGQGAMMTNENAQPWDAGKPEPVRASQLFDTEFLENLRRQMLKFATLQLSDAHLAEDAVQEALIGALKNANSFGGQAALKTWVFAILKNKIADVLRQKQRLVYASSLLHEEEEGEDFSALFDSKGFWQADERIWTPPDLQAFHAFDCRFDCTRISGL